MLVFAKNVSKGHFSSLQSGLSILYPFHNFKKVLELFSQILLLPEIFLHLSGILMGGWHIVVFITTDTLASLKEKREKCWSFRNV